MQIFTSFSIGLSHLFLSACGPVPLYAANVEAQIDRQPVFDMTDAPLISKWVEGAAYAAQAGGDTNGDRLRQGARDEARG